MKTLNFNQFLSFLPDLTEVQTDLLRNKRLTDGNSVFSNISAYEAYDLIEMMNRISSVDDFLSYIQENEFDSPEDIILEYPGAFDQEKENYQIRRTEEETNMMVSESIYSCSKCQKPVISESRQTRGGDEGATVFLICTSCNITTRI